jgi:hypothetical protein
MSDHQINTEEKITPIPTTKPLGNDLLVLQMFDCVQKMFNNRSLDIKSLIELVGLAIQMVENAQINHVFLLGSEKKALVIQFINYALQKLPIIDEDTKQYLEHIFVPTILSDLIDSLCNLNVQSLRLRVADCGLCGLCGLCDKKTEAKHLFPKDVKKKLKVRISM